MNVLNERVYNKHFSLKTKFFNDEYLTPVLSRINKEEKCVY